MSCSVFAMVYEKVKGGCNQLNIKSYKGLIDTS